MMDSYDTPSGVAGFYNMDNVSIRKSKKKVPCAYKIKKRVLGRPVRIVKHRECDMYGPDGRGINCRTVKEVDRPLKGAVVQEYDCDRKKIRVNRGVSVEDATYVNEFGVPITTQRLTPNLSEYSIIGNPQKTGRRFFARNQGDLLRHVVKRNVYDSFESSTGSHSSSYSSSSSPKSKSKSKSKSKLKSKTNSKSKRKAGGHSSVQVEQKLGGEQQQQQQQHPQQQALVGGESKRRHAHEHYRNIQEHARSKGYIPVATEELTNEFGQPVIRHRYIKFNRDSGHGRPEFIATVDGNNWTSMGDASMYFVNGVFQPSLYYSSFSPSERVFITPTYESDGYGMAKPSFYENAYFGGNNRAYNEVFLARTRVPGSFLYRDNISAVPGFTHGFYGVPMRPIGAAGDTLFARFSFSPLDMDKEGLISQPQFLQYRTLLNSIINEGNDVNESIRILEAKLFAPDFNIERARKIIQDSAGRVPISSLLQNRLYSGVQAPSAFMSSFSPIAVIPLLDAYRYSSPGGNEGMDRILSTLHKMYQKFGEAAAKEGLLFASFKENENTSIRLVEAYLLFGLYQLQKQKNKIYLSSNLSEDQKQTLRNGIFSTPSGLQTYFLSQPQFSDKDGIVFGNTQPLNSYGTTTWRWPSSSSSSSPYTYDLRYPTSNTVVFNSTPSVAFGGGARVPLAPHPLQQPQHQPQQQRLGGSAATQGALKTNSFQHQRLQQTQQTHTQQPKQKVIEIVSLERIPKRYERN